MVCFNFRCKKTVHASEHACSTLTELFGSLFRVGSIDWFSQNNLKENCFQIMSQMQGYLLVLQHKNVTYDKPSYHSPLKGEAITPADVSSESPPSPHIWDGWFYLRS